MKGTANTTALQKEFERLIQNIAGEVSRTAVEAAIAKTHSQMIDQHEAILQQHRKLLDTHTANLTRTTEGLHGVGTALAGNSRALDAAAAEARENNAQDQQLMDALRVAIDETRTWGPTLTDLGSLANSHRTHLRVSLALQSLTLLAALGALVLLLVR